MVTFLSLFVQWRRPAIRVTRLLQCLCSSRRHPQGFIAVLSQPAVQIRETIELFIFKNKYVFSAPQTTDPKNRFYFIIIYGQPFNCKWKLFRYHERTSRRRTRVRLLSRLRRKFPIRTCHSYAAARK